MMQKQVLQTDEEMKENFGFDDGMPDSVKG